MAPSLPEESHAWATGVACHRGCARGRRGQPASAQALAEGQSSLCKPCSRMGQFVFEQWGLIEVKAESIFDLICA